MTEHHLLVPHCVVAWLGPTMSQSPMEDEVEVHPKRMKSNPSPSVPSEVTPPGVGSHAPTQVMVHPPGVSAPHSSSAAAEKMMTAIPGQITHTRQQVMSPSGVNLQLATLQHPGQSEVPGTNPPEGVSPRTMVQVVESQFVVVLRG